MSCSADRVSDGASGSIVYSPLSVLVTVLKEAIKDAMEWSAERDTRSLEAPFDAPAAGPIRVASQ
jgi:hypothetical protein